MNIANMITVKKQTMTEMITIAIMLDPKVRRIGATC
jgi:hypothetical protein